LKNNRAQLHIDEQAVEFYQEHFSSVRSGCTYIINSFPLMFECETDDLKSQFASLWKEIGQKVSSSTQLLLDGATLQHIPGSAELPLLQKVILELSQNRSSLCKATGTKENGKPLSIEISPLAIEFFSNHFKSYRKGMMMILNLFPQLFEEVVKDAESKLSDSGKRVVNKVIEKIIPDHSMNAGAHFIPAVEIELCIHSPQLANSDATCLREFSFSQRVCLELMVPENTHTSCFAPKEKELFSILFLSILRDEVDGVFTRAELETIADKLAGFPLSTGYAAGQTILNQLAQPYDTSKIATKVRGLGAGARIALEYLCSAKEGKNELFREIWKGMAQ